MCLFCVRMCAKIFAQLLYVLTFIYFSNGTYIWRQYDIWYLIRGENTVVCQLWWLTIVTCASTWNTHRSTVVTERAYRGKVVLKKIHVRLLKYSLFEKCCVFKNSLPSLRVAAMVCRQSGWSLIVRWYFCGVAITSEGCRFKIFLQWNHWCASNPVLQPDLDQLELHEEPLVSYWPLCHHRMPTRKDPSELENSAVG